MYIREAYLKHLPETNADTAGEGFLELLCRLRKTFLQDVIHWRRFLPSFYLWENSLFTDPEYLALEE